MVPGDEKIAFSELAGEEILATAVGETLDATSVAATGGEDDVDSNTVVCHKVSQLILPSFWDVSVKDIAGNPNLVENEIYRVYLPILEWDDCTLESCTVYPKHSHMIPVHRGSHKHTAARRFPDAAQKRFQMYSSRKSLHTPQFVELLVSLFPVYTANTSHRGTCLLLSMAPLSFPMGSSGKAFVPQSGHSPRRILFSFSRSARSLVQPG